MIAILYLLVSLVGSSPGSKAQGFRDSTDGECQLCSLRIDSVPWVNLRAQC